MGSTVGFCSFCTQHEIARFSLLRPSLPLSLKPRQRLLLILTSMATEDTAWDTDTVLEDTTVDTVLATTVLATTVSTTARGRLRLPLRLRLTLTFCMVDMVLDMVILATATVLATGDTTGDKLPTPLQDLNHRRKTLTLFV